MLTFSQPNLIHHLDECDAALLDQLPFGVVAMTPDGRVTHYNLYESQLAGLSPQRVIGKQFFEEVAPCTNNYLVSGRFLDSGPDATLDEQLPYVFTMRVRPTNVCLRMLKAPGAKHMYLLVERRARG